MFPNRQVNCVSYRHLGERHGKIEVLAKPTVPDIELIGGKITLLRWTRVISGLERMDITCVEVLYYLSAS